MKKILASLLAGAMLVSMAACGGSSASSSSAAPAPAESKASEPAPSDAAPAGDSSAAPEAAGGENKAEGAYIAVVSKGFQHQFWQVVKKGADDAAAAYGVEITFDGPPTESDIAIQVDMLKSALDKKPAAVCLAALDPDAVKEQLDACVANNIPVVGFDSGVPGVDSIYATAATDNNAAAAVAADNLFQNETFKAKFDAATAEAPIKVGVLSQDATSASIIGRTAGFIDKLVELAGADNASVSGHDKYKIDNASAKLQIVVNVPATTSAADQKTGAEALLGEGLAAIYGSNENAAGGILSATNDGNDFAPEGKFKDTVAIGFDAGKTQRTAVENGWFYGAVTQDPYSIGYKAVELAVKAINGEAAPEGGIVDTGAKWYNAEALKDESISQLVYE